MIDWADVYARIMKDFKGKRLLPHLILLGIFISSGFIFGIYYNHSINVTLLIWLMGVLLDYIIFGNEILELFTKNKPFVVEGIIEKRIKKIIVEKDVESFKYYFVMAVEEAFGLNKEGADAMDYDEKEGKQRFEVPESMFLSLKVGDEVALVCTPKDKVWGIIREEDEEVINIEN